MERKVVDIQRLKEKYIFFQKKNGLKIFLKPMEKFSTSIALFCTRFGSVNRKFRREKEADFDVVPDGIAHYLEHKLFENEDGSITFELFAKEKALANAQTSFDSTSYYFVSSKANFLNALSILLDFVQNPYFTDENVEKERGIINQEIKMGEDDPFWNTFFACLNGMYKNSAVNVKIAGSVESISKIDKETLYKCYDSFYCPNNMALVLVGNFNEKDVLELLEEKLEEKDMVFVERFVEKEPKEVVQRFCELQMSVQTPVFCLGFKLSPKKGVELLKETIGLKILCELLFGEGSYLYNLFYKNGLVLGSQIEYEILAGENYLALILSGESQDPKKVLEEISREIEKKKTQGIDKEDFMLVKKVIYKDLVQQFSTTDKLAGFFADCFVENVEVLDKIETIVNIDLSEICSYLQELDVNNCNLTITRELEK